MQKKHIKRERERNVLDREMDRAILNGPTLEVTPMLLSCKCASKSWGRILYSAHMLEMSVAHGERFGTPCPPSNHSAMHVLCDVFTGAEITLFANTVPFMTSWAQQNRSVWYCPNTIPHLSQPYFSMSKSSNGISCRDKRKCVQKWRQMCYSFHNKSTGKNSILHYNSCHPMHRKHNLSVGLLCFKRNCTTIKLSI